jgi:hypothetical protein
MVLAEIGKSLGEDRRFIASCLAVHTSLTTPAEVAKHAITALDLTAIQVTIEVTSWSPIRERPRFQQHINKARILRILDKNC